MVAFGDSEDGGGMPDVRPLDPMTQVEQIPAPPDPARPSNNDLMVQDDEETLAQIFKVRSIPTLVYIPKGETPTIQAGGKTKAELKELIDSILLK